MVKTRGPAGLLAILLFASGVTGFAQQPEAQQPQQADRATPAAQPNNEPYDVRDPVFYPGDTERLKPLVHKLAANVWLDQKDIWTSPFRMHRKDAKWWLLFGGATAALIATDHKSSTLFENSKGQVLWGNRVSKVGASYTLIPLVAGFYAWGVLRDEPKAREVGVLETETLLDSLIMVEILKTATSRNRPDSTKDKGEFFEGGTSFPSGHVIETWSFASLLAHEYKNTKWVPFVAYGLAGVVSAARFSAEKHYASDIVAGAAMGWFIGRYVYQTHMDHAIHHHAWLRPQIMPQLDPVSRTYGVSLAFAVGR
jgi:membrane-associated phospholipid phosphatase